MRRWMMAAVVVMAVVVVCALAGTGRAEMAPGTALEAAVAGYATARAARDAGRFVEAVDLYLAEVDRLVPLTVISAAGPVTVRGTSRTDRVARWYLRKIGHDLGGIYLWRPAVLPGHVCDRLATALQYARESAFQARAGGFPQLPEYNGTQRNITRALDASTTLGCVAPDEVRVFAPAPGDAITDALLAAPEGYGARTRGGAGRPEIHVTAPTDAAVRAAFTKAAAGNAQIIFDVRGPIAIARPLPMITGPYVTIEGNGATLTGDRIGRIYHIIDIRGHDVIVRNLRLRNGGDNIRATGSHAYNVLFDHISSTGAGDDGISIGFGAHDVTLQHSFLAGHTRAIFMKYRAPRNISIHHNWILRYWIRAPLVSGVTNADFRNNIVEDWNGWGTRFEYASSGNAVNNLFVLSPYARSIGGKPNALRLVATGPTFAAGNVFRGVCAATTESRGSESRALVVAPVTTQSVAEMEPLVRAHAGCMPRDAWDQAYIDVRQWARLGDTTPLRLPAP